MGKLIFTFLCFWLVSVVFAQSGQHPPYFKACENDSATEVEKSNCSMQALSQYMHANLQIPDNLDVSGTVYISFSVEKTGVVVKIRLEKTLSPACDSAALAVVRHMPAWIPAQQNNVPTDYDMILPIKFRQADDSAESNGFQLTWGQLNGQKTSKETLLQLYGTPLIVRDESGNLLDINGLLFERERHGHITETKSNGSLTEGMYVVIKKLRIGDVLTVTATVQRNGKFYYVERRFVIEN